MSTRRTIALSGVLLILSLGTLTMGLAGCGGQEVGPDGQVKVAPVLNPAPGVVPIEDEYKQQPPTGKTR